MFKGILRIFYKPYLEKKQKEVNDLLEATGFSDEVLEKQLYINKKRNQLNLNDIKGWSQ